MTDPQPPPRVLGSQYGVDEMLDNAELVQGLTQDNAWPPANPSQWQPRYQDMYPTSEMSHLSHGAYGSPSFISPSNRHPNTLYQASPADGHREAAYAHMHSAQLFKRMSA
ncbi:TPA: hypothetical protein ACH3X1_008582 [Trebouxia sp. C0004]